MNGEEIALGMMEFDLLLKRYPELKKDINPELPYDLMIACMDLAEYAERPSENLLYILYELSLDWENVEKKYRGNLDRCRQRIGELKLPKSLQVVIELSYVAFEKNVENMGKHLEHTSKIFVSSKLAEERAEEFFEFVEKQAPFLYKQFDGCDEEKGGLIFWENGNFEIQFKENESVRILDRIIKRVKEGQMTEEDYDIVFERVKLEIEKAKKMFAPNKVGKMYEKVIMDMEKLHLGILTQELERYLRGVFKISYANDVTIFEDRSLFLEDSNKRFFAWFHHHPNSQKIVHRENYVGPSPQDLRNTFRIGPQVIYSPAEGGLQTDLIVKGKTLQKRVYKV
ncbi:hypothetical protein KO465_08580 [Candidatus Micrarchaeota archaeon]|nr:hypothetical protein [Candidatus Micrarchaeota archaeon]